VEAGLGGFKGFLSKDGRIGRRGYVLGFAVPLGVLLALSWVGFSGAAGEASSQVVTIAAVGWTILLGLGDAMNVRRYHDIGNSGRLYLLLRPGVVLLPLVAFGLQFILPAMLASTGDVGALTYMIGQDMHFGMAPAPLAVLVVWAAGIALNVGFLCVAPGDAGPNEYGDGQGGSPAPVNAPSADPVARAMAEYQASLAAPKAAAATMAAARPASAMVTRVAARPGGTFGKKR
jgi:uncharacterized membrane protein YhaH (DUF805 family)